MKNKARDLTSYTFQKDEPLLLDTNVWLYLFPAPSDRAPFHAASYSRALKAMLTAGSRLVMDALVTIKIATGQFRDQVELNQILRGPHRKTSAVEPRRGYKLVTFTVDRA